MKRKNKEIPASTPSNYLETGQYKIKLYKKNIDGYFELQGGWEGHVLTNILRNIGFDYVITTPLKDGYTAFNLNSFSHVEITLIEE